MASPEPRVAEVRIELGPAAYSVWVGRGLLGDRARLRGAVRGNQALIVSNETVAPLYLEPVRDALAGLALETLVLPDGERYKNLDEWRRVQDRLIARGFLRDACVIALGGGVVGDLAGFAAATYMRGIDFVQIPTTLLAQVDASVGGKTAVNHRAGKNLIGAFHQPRLVLADLDALGTLPDREFRAGLAEVIKYGLIRDAGFLDWLDRHVDALLARDPAALGHAVVESVRHKAEVVAADEREHGARALLNLGHTFGHALEALTGYRRYLHGEAVAIGMLLAARLSARLGALDPADPERVADLLRRAGLPLQPPPEIAPAAMLERMRLDKKNRAGALRLVLLDALGAARVRDDADDGEILAVLHP